MSTDQARVAIGHSPPRPDGYDKVTGRANYIDDIEFADLWHGATVRCPHARARIVSIDTSKVTDREAVIITAKDLPGPNAVRAISDDWRALADGEVQHAYEAVALVAAPTLERARAAVHAIHVTYECLPPILTYEEALAQGDAGLFSKCAVNNGNVETAFQDADLVVEGTYETGHQEHLYIETHGIVALVAADGEIEVAGSLQCPYYVQKALKYFTGRDRIRVRQATTGGGFGGKEDCPSFVACHAVALTIKAGHPVKIVYDRREDIVATSKRHPSRIHIRSAVQRDGTLLAHDIDILFDGGAYTTMSPVVLSRGALHSPGPYRCPNVRVRARAVRTNTCANGAFRGFGAPQTQYAIERHIDRIARAVGIDPLTMREKNAYVEGDITATGQVLTGGVSARQCLHEAALRTDFRRRWFELEAQRQASLQTQTHTPPSQRGLGLALFWHGSGFTGNGEKRICGKVEVALCTDGMVEVRAASTEIGQGTTIAFQQIAASFGLPPHRVRVVLADTARVPDSGPTVASRTIMVVGELVGKASTAMVHKLAAFAANRAGITSCTLNGDRFVGHDGGDAGTFDDIVATYLKTHGPTAEQAQFQPLAEQDFDEATYRGTAYPTYAWGCCVVEVEVDSTTLAPRPVNVTTVSDVGRVIHPVLCSGQVEGGTLQALGWGYLEEMKMRDGFYQNDRLATYLIATSLDAPEFDTVLLENPGPTGPQGAKGIGELPMDGAAAAVAGAIENATGLVLSALPATAERLHQALCAGHTARPLTKRSIHDERA